MAERFLAELFTPEVLAAQTHYSRRSWPQASDRPFDRLGPDEVAFIAERDSFYMATVSSRGWPYVQHRGGEPGFLRVVGERTIAFADLRGNRQLISTGNLAGDDRVAMILMDYPNRTRLKLLGHARMVDPHEHAGEQLVSPELARRVERVVSVDIVGFDWNCPAYITPRYTIPQIEALTAPLRLRIAALEAELDRVRTADRR